MIPDAFLAIQGWWVVPAVINEHSNSIINDLFIIFMFAIQCMESARFFCPPCLFSESVCKMGGKHNRHLPSYCYPEHTW